MSQKDQYRSSFQIHKSKPEKYGKLSQKIRGCSPYHLSRQIFISLEPVLSQCRINALLDGKEIIVPGPGLKQGFYHLKPFSIPFKKLSFAVTPKGIAQFGKLLKQDELSLLNIGLLLSGATAIDRSGVRLGDGNGFFDISFAVLSHYKSLNEDCVFYSVVDDLCRIHDGSIPSFPWDIKPQAVITPVEKIDFNNELTGGEIYWEEISKKRIRKITPLWNIYKLDAEFQESSGI